MNKIREEAVETGEIEGYEYWIAKCPVSHGFNGYIVFPKRPVREQGYDGVLTYVPVHGGITYVGAYNSGVVYGFDTAHYNSDKYPIEDFEWIKSQIKIMLLGILKAKEVEAKYLKALTNKTKAKYVQMVIDVGGKGADWQNVGVMINLLSGKV